MLKYINKIFQIFIDILVFIITIFILLSISNYISLKVMHKQYNNILGYTIFEIVSGSMEPTLSIKDLIIIKNTTDIKENDIITYIDNKDYITHRVIKIEGNTITTKGDSNNSTDVKINKERVIGKVVLVLPKAGIIREILTTPKVLITLIITLILISLSISYIPKEKRRKITKIEDNFEDPNCLR